MAYYGMGDYYRGDYYRGDPGLFGGIAKLAGKVIGAVVKRSPIGVAGGIAGGVLGAFTGRPTMSGAPGLPLPGPFRMHPGAILPGGRPFITREGGQCPPGYHLDKKTRTTCVRNRSMNPANPRALRRAVRREHSFVALAKRVLRGTGISIGRRSFGTRRKFGAKR